MGVQDQKDALPADLSLDKASFCWMLASMVALGENQATDEVDK